MSNKNGKGDIERPTNREAFNKHYRQMRWPMKLRVYKVQGRNGYYAVDEYKSNTHSSVTRTVATNLTKKQAKMVASEIEMALYYFVQDNKLEGM